MELIHVRHVQAFLSLAEIANRPARGSLGYAAVMLSAGATRVRLDGNAFDAEFPRGVITHRKTTERAMRNASRARDCADAMFLDADTFSRLAVELAFGGSAVVTVVDGSLAVRIGGDA
jgi:hypothetical protein